MYPVYYNYCPHCGASLNSYYAPVFGPIPRFVDYPPVIGSFTAGDTVEVTLTDARKHNSNS